MCVLSWGSSAPGWLSDESPWIPAEQRSPPWAAAQPRSGSYRSHPLASNPSVGLWGRKKMVRTLWLTDERMKHKKRTRSHKQPPTRWVHSWFNINHNEQYENMKVWIVQRLLSWLKVSGEKETHSLKDNQDHQTLYMGGGCLRDKLRLSSLTDSHCAAEPVLCINSVERQARFKLMWNISSCSQMVSKKGKAIPNHTHKDSYKDTFVVCFNLFKTYILNMQEWKKCCLIHFFLQRQKKRVSSCH